MTLGTTGQINLGEINVLAKDEVSLQDIDLREIPANLNIVQNPDTKIAIAIGLETTNDSVKKFVLKSQGASLNDRQEFEQEYFRREEL